MRLIANNQWRPIFQTRRSLLTKPWPTSYFLYRGGLGLFLCDQVDLEKAGRRALVTWLLNRKKRKQALRAWRMAVWRLLAFIKRLDKENLAMLNGRQLSNDWTKLNQLIEDFWRVGIIPEIAGYGAVPLLNQVLSRNRLFNSTRQDIIADLSVADRLSFYQIEERDLLRINRLRSNNSRERALQRHAITYAWIGNSYGATGITPPSTFSRRFRASRLNWRRRLEDIERMVSTNLEKRTRALKEIKADERLTQLARAIGLCVGWQDERKGIIFRYLSALDALVAEFARRAQVPQKLFEQAIWTEVKQKLTRIQKEVLRERLNSPYILRMDRRGLRVIQGSIVHNVIKKYWRPANLSGSEIIKGIVAFGNRSTIRGNVYIVRNHRDLKTFPRGRIMMTAMTAPEYIVAMRRAKAVVTDAGGITSHAAIVSRELRLPCLVGTKHATRVFRTGDQVKIDTKTGVVSRI